MSAVEAAPFEAESRAECDPLGRVGGPPLELISAVPVAARAMTGELLVQLRCVCGSLARTQHGYAVTSPAGWRSLAETPEQGIVWACRRTARAYPGFALPGTDQQPVHVRLGFLLARLEADA